MTRRSQTVQDKIHELYALMATAAAKKAMSSIEDWNDIPAADRWAEATARWLDASSAKQSAWAYSRPIVKK